jgi:hypothetical protein
MVSMVDRDMSGTLGFNEFKELWTVLNGWRQHFISFDSDRSGFSRIAEGPDNDGI